MCDNIAQANHQAPFRQQAWARSGIALHRHARFAGYRWCLCSLSREPRHLLNWTFSDVSPVATCAQPSKRRTPTTRLLEYARVSLIERRCASCAFRRRLEKQKAESALNENYDELIRVAALQRQVDLTGEPAAEFEAELAKLSGIDLRLLTLAAKLLEGKQYQIVTDKPDNAKQYRALGQHVGAAIEVAEIAGRFTRIIFRPPAAQ